MLQSKELLEKFFFSIFKLEINDFKEEKQNREYEGFTFSINEQLFRSRLARKTPKKKEHFVAFWEKDEYNNNQPYLYNNSPSKIIISMIVGEKKGIFIFPRLILLDKKILKTDKQKGKMAIRVYPTWEKELNDSAKRTQNWQKDYFIDLLAVNNLDKAKTLIYRNIA
ncbi:hypothetical protein GCM10025886_05920 [Tetragenococcus halophilus subsp. flandriensis]|uniref:MepB family protein n=1 Tax=Tetragenococcus halophilus TaxID=51669 RepID=UPI0023E92D71|nr:MepB family protein [Tetragenococcus halophilus]GMA07441.1 hypothetical protein GCM10025886_05920 [Tetragenococcus halophilus subsp. flandriensis]